MHSFFTDAPRNGLVRFSEEDARHIRKSLRLKEGDRLAVVFEGARHEAAVAVVDGALCARVLQPLPSNEPNTRVTLYQGLPKGDKMDSIVQKCTELGVHRVVPCLFSRCVARWESGDKKLKRWQRIAREAAIQCGRTQVPEVADCLLFDSLPQALAGHETVLIPWEEGGQPLRQTLGNQQDIALVIGPEGGISPEEVQVLSGTPVTLGPRILRTETAGLAALTMVLSHLGEME